MPKASATTIARDAVRRSAPPPRHHDAPPAQAEDILSPFDRHLVGDARVQYRLPLLDPVQVKRDLMLLRSAVDQALTHLDQPERKDRSILLAVRGLIKRANDTANARWRGGNKK